MALNTQVRLSLVDNISSGIKNVNSSFERMTGSINNSTQAMRRLNTTFESKNLLTARKSIDETTAMLSRLTYSASRYLIIYKALGTVGNVWDMMVGGSARYAKYLETATVGMAGILSSMTTLNGKTLEWNQALGTSAEIIRRLKEEAIKSSATTEDLARVFQAILGPGLGAGMKIDEIIKFTTVGTNAVKSLGLGPEQLVQELRDLVQGGIAPASSTLATALGLKDADIKEAKKSAEGLFKFLMRRIEGFAKATAANANTLEGRIARIDGAIKDGVREGSSKLYDYYSTQMGLIADSLVIVKEEANEAGEIVQSIEINPAIKETTEVVSRNIITIAETVKDLGGILGTLVSPMLSTVGSLLENAIGNAKSLLLTFTVFKGSQYIKDALNVFRGGKATNKGGELGNWIYQMFTNAEEKANKLIAAQEKLNDVTNKYLDLSKQNASIQDSLEKNADGIFNLGNKWKYLNKETAEYKALLKSLSTIKFNDDSASKYYDSVVNRLNALNRQEGINKVAAEIRVEAGQGITNSASNALGNLTNDQAAYSKLRNSKREEDSVLRLAELYKRLGVEAKKAEEMQLAVQELVIKGANAKAAALMKTNAEYAKGIANAKAMDAAWKEALASGMKTLDGLGKSSESLDSNMKYIEKFLKSDKALASHPKKIEALFASIENEGLSKAEAAQMVKMYVSRLRAGSGSKEMYQAITDEAKRLGEVKRNLANQDFVGEIYKRYEAVDYKKMTAEQQKFLAFDAEQVLARNKNIEQVKLIKQAYIDLDMAQKGNIITEQERTNLTTALQMQVASGHTEVAASIAKEIALHKERGNTALAVAAKRIDEEQQAAAAARQLIAIDAEEINLQQRRLLEQEAINKVTLTGNNTQINNMKTIISQQKELESQMRKMGVSTEKTYNNYISMLQKVITAKGKLETAQLKEYKWAQAEALQNSKNTKGKEQLLERITMLSVGVNLLSEEWAKTIGVSNEAFGAITAGITTLSNMSSAIDALKGSLGTLGLAVSGVAAAIAALIYAKKKWYDEDPNSIYDKLQTYADQEGADIDVNQYRPKNNMIDFRRLEAQSIAKQKELPETVDTNSVTQKFPQNDNDAQNKIDRQKMILEQNLTNLSNLMADLETKILEQTGTATQISMAKVSEEITKIEGQINKAKIAGVDAEKITEATAKKDQYKQLAISAAARESTDQEHELNMNNIDLSYQLGEISYDRAKELRAEELKDYTASLQAQLNDATLNEEAKYQIRKKYAQANEELQKISAKNIGDHMKNALASYRKEVLESSLLDQEATIKDGLMEMTSTITNFGQNLLTEQKTWSDRVKQLFNDLANTIMNTVMKISMQGITESIIKLIPLPGHAKGGVATGWSIVGEEGPELVNFTQPGRVYTAAETAKALSVGANTRNINTPSGAGGQNVKVIIENRSGQNVKASAANASFNPKEMILNVVLEAVATNDGGINNILRGAIGNGY